MSENISNIIPRVDGNMDKEKTYRKLHEHYQESVCDGYYLEAMVLVYAMLEDRFNEILRMLEIADYGKKSIVIVNGLERDIFDLLHHKPNKDNMIRELKTIGIKCSIVEKLASENKDCPECLLSRKQIVISADNNRDTRGKTGRDSKSIKKIITEVTEWNKLRNQYIHALFNKQFDEAMERLPNHVEKGLDLARELDNYCGRVETLVKENLDL